MTREGQLEGAAGGDFPNCFDHLSGSACALHFFSIDPKCHLLVHRLFSFLGPDYFNSGGKENLFEQILAFNSCFSPFLKRRLRSLTTVLLYSWLFLQLLPISRRAGRFLLRNAHQHSHYRRLSDLAIPTFSHENSLRYPHSCFEIRVLNDMRCFC